MPNRLRGFTTIELMVVLTIVAILTTLAAPGFRHIYQSSIISTAVNGFLADLRFARSEALKRGGHVVMCRSNAPEAADPRCHTGQGTDGWKSGWLVFHDGNGDGDFDTGELILRIQQPVSRIDSIYSPSNTSKFRFNAAGRISAGGLAKIQFGGIDTPTELERIVCVSIGGRGRIAGDGNTECA